MNKAPTIAILYIATGRYVVYWEEFYKTAQKHFLPDCTRKFILFTDRPTEIQCGADVEIVPIEHLGWPYITLLRYRVFLQHRHLWNDADYVFFLNANDRFLHRITRWILPDDTNGGLVAAVHRGSEKKHPDRYSYERRAESRACIPLGQGSHYFAGGFNGGTSAAYEKMCTTINEWIEDDLSRDIIARWHDESHLNRYLVDSPVKVLPDTFVHDENKVRWYNRWRIYAELRDKNKLGGHQFMRGINVESSTSDN